MNFLYKMKMWIVRFMEGRYGPDQFGIFTLIAGLVLSLLSGFTGQWADLLAGVNIGGLGTPIASLASLITLKLYIPAPGAKVGKFLAVFTAVNVIGLMVLLGFYLIF